jgi:O-antigen/teichoic acid export membrane protein
MRSLLANGLAMLAARLTMPVFSFAINVGIARLCGPEVLGSYVHLLALVAIFQTAATAGMGGLLTRELAAHPEQTEAHLRRARSLASLTGLGATAGFLIAAGLAAPERWQEALILGTTVLPSSWSAIQESFFMATRTHHRVTLIAIAENGLKATLAGAALWTGGGLVFLCWGVALSRGLALALGAALVSRAGAGRRSWRPVGWSEIRGFARGVAPFAVLLVVSTTYFKLDVLLVEALLGPGPTGVYGAALAFYSAALLIPDSVMAALYPRLAMRHRRSPEEFAEATLLSVRLVMAGLVPVSLGLICASDLLLELAYGGRYAGAAPLLRLLAASLPLHAANGALGQGLLAGHIQRPLLGVVLAGLAAHALLCAALLPRLGLAGAPASLLLSSAIVAAGSALVFHRRVSRLAPGPRTLGASAAMASAIGLTLAAPGRWNLTAGAAALVVLAAAAHKALLSPADWKQLREAITGVQPG